MTDLRHLVVVIPGIGGTVLRDPERAPGDDLVWYGHRNALLQALLDPERLAIARSLEPVKLLQDFAVIPWFKNIDGYTRLWNLIRNAFPDAHASSAAYGPDGAIAEPGGSIVAFPYDFRLGVEHASERLAAMIEDRAALLGDETKVIIVAHSMGGLVARHWVAHHDEGGRCRGLVTLGSPHGGAPKALDILINGLHWKSRVIQRRALSEVLQAWPGLHDLVGTEARVVDDRSGERRRPHELRDLPAASLLDRQATLHRSIGDWWANPDREHRPSLLPYAGQGHGTLSLTSWDGTRLRSRKGRLDGEPEGDATVPYWSATPSEWSGDLATTGVRACEDRHGSLVAPAGLRAALLALNGVNPPPDRGEEASVTTPRLGVSIDDIIGPGERLEGTVLFGDQPFVVASPDDDAGGARVSATLIAESGEATPLTVEAANDGRFGMDVPDDTGGDILVSVRWYRTVTDEGFETSERVAVVA
jgi:pimeloyl-ACP methyl ester carboxylesterase